MLQNKDNNKIKNRNYVHNGFNEMSNIDCIRNKNIFFTISNLIDFI